MKKLFFIGLMICFTFASCGNKSKTIVIDPIFSCSFSAEYNDTSIKGDINVSDDNVKIVITEPDVIKGVTLTANNNQVSLEYMGLTKTFSQADYPQIAFISSIKEIISDVSMNKPEAVVIENGYGINGSFNGYEYNLIIDNDLLISKIYVPSIDLSVELYDYK